MSEPVHRGLIRYTNPINKFRVIEFHYSADPDKSPETPQGREWIQRAKEGTPQAVWDQEYEMDPNANLGDRIYSEYGEHNVCEPFEVPEYGYTRFMTLDPGIRNECGALWGAVDKDGALYVYREHYVAGKHVDWHAARIKIYEKGEKIRTRAIDPSARNAPPRTMSAPNAGNSVLNDFRDHGLNFLLANNDWQAGVNKVNQWLKVDPTTKLPRIYIFRSCRNLIWEIENYRWKQVSETVMESHDPPEEPKDKADHLVDCLRYMVMMKPRYYPPQLPWDERKPRKRARYKNTGFI